MVTVNKINGRKEFFHVKLSEIEKVISECGVSFKMVNEPYARDYRESIKCSNKMNKNSIEEDSENKYPSSLYYDEFLDDTEIE